MSERRTIRFNLRDARADPTLRVWDLPPWGHPAALMVMPLFLCVRDRFIPIGSAFVLNGALGLVMSALHNIEQALVHEPPFDRRRAEGNLPKALTLQHAGLSVLHHIIDDTGVARFSFLPIGSIDGAPPSDLVIGAIDLPDGTPTLALPMRFAIPDAGETVWSLGYCDFRFPEGGIPIDAIKAGTFDWARDYVHCLRVVEAQVAAAFTVRFATRFVDGPCFAFDEAIAHGMSGGPVISEDGFLVGINSAGAESFFDAPMSIASMLYPLLLTNVRAQRSFGPITFKTTQPLFHLIARGTIKTDGSEERIGFSGLESAGEARIHGAAPVAHQAIFDDFAGYQLQRRASTVGGPLHHLVRRGAEGPEAEG